MPSKQLYSPLYKPYKPKLVQQTSPSPDPPTPAASSPQLPISLLEDGPITNCSIVASAIPLARRKDLPQAPVFEQILLTGNIDSLQSQVESDSVIMSDPKLASGDVKIPKPDIKMTGMSRASPAVLATRKIIPIRKTHVPQPLTPTRFEHSHEDFEASKDDANATIELLEKQKERDQDTIHNHEDEHIRLTEELRAEKKRMADLEKLLKDAQAEISKASALRDKQDADLHSEREQNYYLKQDLQAAAQKEDESKKEINNLSEANTALRAEYDTLFVNDKTMAEALMNVKHHRDELEQDVVALQKVQIAWQQRDKELEGLDTVMDTSMAMLQDAEEKCESLIRDKEDLEYDNTKLQHENQELIEQLQRAYRDKQAYLETAAQADLLSPGRMLSPVRQIANVHRSLDHELSSSAFVSPTTDVFEVERDPGVDSGTQTDFAPVVDPSMIDAGAQTTEQEQPASLDYSTVTTSLALSPVTPAISQMVEAATQTDAPNVSDGQVQTELAQPNYATVLPLTAEMSHAATQTETPDVAEPSHETSETDAQDVVSLAENETSAQLSYSILDTIAIAPIAPVTAQISSYASQTQTLAIKETDSSSTQTEASAFTTTSSTQTDDAAISMFGIRVHPPVKHIHFPRYSAIMKVILLAAFLIFFNHACEYAKLSSVRHDWVKGNEFTRESVVNLRRVGLLKNTGRELSPGLVGWISHLLCSIPFSLSVFYDPQYLNLMVDLGQMSEYGTRFLA